ncbi:MAG: hypothetical protein IKP72_06095, partial [Clostridia bacterium]|nr:hypothetical protein [Clostridia bacterium]
MNSGAASLAALPWKRPEKIRRKKRLKRKKSMSSNKREESKIPAKRLERLQALLQTDAPLWEAGVHFAGMDEAGRGPLAGNVVAACVVMPKEPLIAWVDDSKKLSAQR